MTLCIPLGFQVVLFLALPYDSDVPFDYDFMLQQTVASTGLHYSYSRIAYLN